MDNFEKILLSNRDWAINRVQKMCNTDDPIDYLDAYSIVLEFQEWIDSKDDENVISFTFEEFQ